MARFGRNTKSVAKSKNRFFLAFRVAVIIALAGCSLYWLGSKVARPFTLLSSTNREVHELDAKLQAMRAENEGLRRGIIFMNTPEGKAQAGRWSGLVMKGERRLLIPEDSAPTEQ